MASKGPGSFVFADDVTKGEDCGLTVCSDAATCYKVYWTLLQSKDGQSIGTY